MKKHNVVSQNLDNNNKIKNPNTFSESMEEEEKLTKS